MPSRRQHVIIVAALVGVIAACALLAAHLWRQQQRAAVAVAGVAPVPDLKRWPSEFRERVAEASQDVGHARAPLGALVTLADLYCANGFTREAEQALGALRRLDPSNARWPYLMADARLRGGDQEGAEPDLRAAVKLDAGYAPAWIRLGELLAGRGAFEQARDCFAQAVAAAPDNVWARYDSISLEAVHGTGVGDWRRRLEELARAQPTTKEVHALMAESLAASHDLAGAERERRIAANSELNIGTQDPWVDELYPLCYDSSHMMVRAIEMRREGRFDETEKLLTRVAKLAPHEASNPLAWDLLSNFYLKTGRLAEARSVLKTAVAEFPEEPQMPLLQARLFCAEHEPGAAVEVARRALGRWPERADLHAALGVALRDGGDFAAGAAALRDAIRLDPTLTEAQFDLGTCLIEQGARAEARAAFARALEMRPDYPEALLAISQIDLESGNYASAQTYVSKLFDQNPDDPKARRLLAAWHMVKGMAARESGDLEQAETDYRAGLALSADYAALLKEAGQLSGQRGKLAQAALDFQGYVRVEPDDPEGYRLLGLTLQGAGRTAEAKTAFEQGLGAAQKAGDQSRADEFRRLLER
jgi:tetratricopeptide (TPR) repeat protein